MINKNILQKTKGQMTDQCLNKGTDDRSVPKQRDRRQISA